MMNFLKLSKKDRGTIHIRYYANRQIRWLVFFNAKLKGNACGRKGSIRDLQPGRQLHCCGTDRIHRDRDKL